MLQVLAEMPAINHDVVEKDEYKPANEGLEEVIHGGLKGRGRVAETEGHHTVLVVTMVSPEGGFGNVRRAHADLMETLGQIQF